MLQDLNNNSSLALKGYPVKNSLIIIIIIII